MIVLEGVPLTPGAALDPLDPHFKPNPDRATPILDRPLLVPLDTPHVPSHLKASTSTSQLASSSHSDPAPYTLRLITYGFERGRPDITPALTFDIRDLPNPPKPVREAHLGTSEVMQEWFFADDGVRLRFKEVLHEVLDAVGRFYEEHRDEERSDNDHAHDNEAARHTLTIAVCCRKGKHRSVAFVERLARELRKTLAHDVWRVEVSHRDVHLPKSRPSTAVPSEMSALTSDTAQLSDETSSASASVASRRARLRPQKGCQRRTDGNETSAGGGIVVRRIPRVFHYTLPDSKEASELESSTTFASFRLHSPGYQNGRREHSAHILLNRGTRRPYLT